MAVPAWILQQNHETETVNCYLQFTRFDLDCVKCSELSNATLFFCGVTESPVRISFSQLPLALHSNAQAK